MSENDRPRADHSQGSGQRRDYTADEIADVWMKAKRPDDLPQSAEWRIDALGNRIRWEEYGKRTEHGWVIDHIVPLAKGGKDELENWQALQWKANLRKGAS